MRRLPRKQRRSSSNRKIARRRRKDQKTKANEEQRKQLEQQKQAAQPRVPPPAGAAGPGAGPWRKARWGNGGARVSFRPRRCVRRSCLLCRPMTKRSRWARLFATKVVVKAAKANEFSRLDIWITYSPLMVRPVRVFDYPIAKLVDTSKPMTSTHWEWA